MIDDDSTLSVFKTNFSKYPAGDQKHLNAAIGLMLNPVEINVQLVHPNAKLPTKGDPEKYDHIRVEDYMYVTNVCYDIFVVADEAWHDSPTGKYFELMPNTSKTFHTGIKVAAPPIYGFLLRERSGLGVKDMGIGAGVIEGTYRGEWRIHIRNHSFSPQLIKEGDKICQAALVFIIPSVVKQVEELPSTVRGEKGFGSSGR